MAIGAFAAISAAMAVAAGAFGAHGAAGQQEAEWLRTGGLYQLVHAVAALAIMGFARGPAIMLLGGAAIFSITLYAMALGAPRWLGAVTPIGGGLLIIGWRWAGWLFWRGSPLGSVRHARFGRCRPHLDPRRDWHRGHAFAQKRNLGRRRRALGAGRTREEVGDILEGVECTEVFGLDGRRVG